MLFGWTAGVSSCSVLSSDESYNIQYYSISGLSEWKFIDKSFGNLGKIAMSFHYYYN